MVFNTRIIVIVSVFLFVYTGYKYLFYSAFCNPISGLSIQVSSALNMIGLGTDFMFWVIPIMIFFWPTKAQKHTEHVYRKARRQWSEYSTRSSNSNSI